MCSRSGTYKYRVVPTKLVILTVPYCEPMPMAAPVLLSACLTNQGISAAGYDFSIKFVTEFQSKDYWFQLKHLLTQGQLQINKLPRRGLIDVLKFTKRHLAIVDEKYRPEYVGLSLFTNESIAFSHVMCYAIKRWFPHWKIIFGGRALELDYKGAPLYQYLDKQRFAETIIVGDAEISLPMVFKNNITGIFHSPPQTKDDLDNIPLPNWHDYNMQEYHQFKYLHYTPKSYTQDSRYFSITGSKGCVRSCSFCDVASFWPKYIYRDGDKIAREMIENYRKTGINFFRFTDNLMNGSVTHYRKMNQILATEVPNEIKYAGYAIFRSKEHCRAEDFRTMATAGCFNWRIGVESGSERVRQHMKKGFSDDDIDWTTNQLYDNGISQSWLLMVGYPTETREDYQATKNMLTRYAHLCHDRMITVNVTPGFMMLKHSPLWQEDMYHQQLRWLDDHQRYWTIASNPDNIFLERVDRWFDLYEHTTSLGYEWSEENTRDKFARELQILKQGYYDYIANTNRIADHQ